MLIVSFDKVQVLTQYHRHDLDPDTIQLDATCYVTRRLDILSVLPGYIISCASAISPNRSLCWNVRQTGCHMRQELHG